ncbi:MAG: PAC2 family protein [Candidatus Woesearchaeota archaeon]
MAININYLKKGIKTKNPIFIEGLPGIGNVGKVSADFLIDELKAEKIIEITSDTFPNYVFVEQNNLVKLPKISMYFKKVKNQDFLLMTGDIQPTDESASYALTENILDILEKHGVKKIITLGGIGLNDIPKNPKVFCTGNSQDFIEEFRKIKASNKLYGIVGPIIGVTGLLLGMGAKKNMKAVALLAETYNHPLYIGLDGAKAILKTLALKYGFGISFKQLNMEIKELQNELETIDQQVSEGMEKITKHRKKDLYYIG